MIIPLPHGLLSDISSFLFFLLFVCLQSDFDHEGSALLSAYKKGGFMTQLNSDSNDFDSEAVVNVLVMGVTGGIGIDQRSFDPKKRENRNSTVVPGEVELRL